MISTPNGSPHLIGRQRKQAAARLRGVQIEHRDHVAGADSAEAPEAPRERGRRR